MAPSSAEFSYRTRQEIWAQLKSRQQKPLNVAIVGGGIVGAGLLREFALRGENDVVLFEKKDFASATSGYSSKLIHAGIRYLEQVWVHLKHLRVLAAWQNLRFVTQASLERKRLGTLAPGLVKPKPIFLVLAKSDPRSVLSVISGVWIYYLTQLCQGQFFSVPRMAVSKRAIKKAAPELDSDRVKACFSFWDSETDDARLVIETLRSAYDNGAKALNYMELIEYSQMSDHVEFAIKDNESGEILRLRAKKLIDATGPFVDDTRRRENVTRSNEPLVDRVAGAHIDVYPAVSDKSFYVSASDNRLVFLLKRNEDGLVYTRIGTTERPLAENESSDDPIPTTGEIEYLKSIAKEYFPQAVIDNKTIVRLNSGIRPLRAQHGVGAFQKSREHDILVEGNVVRVIGVKLTDFRRVAEEVGDLFHLPNRNRSKIVPIRSEAVDRIYCEASMEEIVRRTMPLHWDDYVLRRKGLKPLLDLKIRPNEYQSEFNAFADRMGWTSEQRHAEKENVSQKREVPRPGER